MNKSGIQVAVDAAGGRVQLAQAMGVSSVAVHNWVKRGWVSPRRAQEIERAFGIPCAMTLNPSIVQMVTGTNR